MSLLDDVFSLCNDKLVGKGWDDLFKAVGGLKIKQSTPEKLAAELARPLPAIDRSVAGFEDFALAGNRGIEPEIPARSLLYHALASPNVLNAPDGSRLGYFPTLKNLEDAENYIFGVQQPSIPELLQRANATALAVVVFAYEYRPAPQTPHRQHADMVFCRTGIARVGTADANYVPVLRGFIPEQATDAHAICVCPARYGAFLAVQRNGDPSSSLPMNFKERIPSGPNKEKGDGARPFWVPVHKLFSGKGCLTELQDTDIEVKFVPEHVNEKIFRIHSQLPNQQPPKDAFPYRFTGSEIADNSAAPEHGAGVISPKVRPRLVDEAKNGAIVTFTVPPGNRPDFSSFETAGGAIPEYIHVRTEVLPDGTTNDLNALPEQSLIARIGKGKYEALHYVDYTGEGWISVKAPEVLTLKKVAKKPVAAYSLVSAPDFFHATDQRELTEWTASAAVPESIKDQIWDFQELPTPLSDVRLPPNLQLKKSPFLSTDETATALVAMTAAAPSTSPMSVPEATRHSHLADDAAGFFAPGWDVTVDTLDVNGTPVDHLAAYGLGSPFPEDAKLCAALSTFWPAAAPDATREMEPARGNQSGTVAPLTDEEIGQIGGLPWDGVPGPQVVSVGGQDFVEYASFQHVDYVHQALAGRFSLRLTSRIDVDEYKRRVLSSAFAHLALGFEHSGSEIDPATLKAERRNWKMLSFRRADQGSPELQQAILQSGLTLHGVVYRLEAFLPLGSKPPAPGSVTTNPAYPFALFPVPGNEQKKRLKVVSRFIVFVAPDEREVAVRKSTDATFHKGRFHV